MIIGNNKNLKFVSKELEIINEKIFSSKSKNNLRKKFQDCQIDLKQGIMQNDNLTKEECFMNSFSNSKIKLKMKDKTAKNLLLQRNTKYITKKFDVNNNRNKNQRSFLLELKNQ